jgi:predicted NodU family carbamoyl transferase
MKILGLNIFSHDTAACLFVNGQLIGAIEEERLNGQKHTQRFPLMSVQILLKRFSLTVHDIDEIAIGWNFIDSVKNIYLTPALMNDFIAMQKDVGLISVLGAVDAVRAAQIETAAAFNFSPYVLAGLLFVLLSLPMIRISDWYTGRLRKREQMGALV